MLSSLNAFGGLSAANLLTLLGANSASSSNSPSASAARSASADVSASDANDPAKAIKAILAQAQMETSAGGSTSIATAEAAYAAQTETSGGESAAGATAQTAHAAQTDNVISSFGASATLSSLDAVSEAFNAGLGIYDVASLAVIAGNEVVSMTTADMNGDGNQALEPAVLYRASEALEFYQYQSMAAQQEQAASSIPASATSAPSASASGGTSDSSGNPKAEQSVLRLTIAVSQQTVDPQVLDPQVEAQAQQLISAFENHTLESTSAIGAGFSYVENFGAATTVLMTGIVVSGSDIPTGNSGSAVSGFQDLANESTQFSGGVGSGGGALTFTIPLGGS